MLTVVVNKRERGLEAGLLHAAVAVEVDGDAVERLDDVLRLRQHVRGPYPAAPPHPTQRTPDLMRANTDTGNHCGVKGSRKLGERSGENKVYRNPSGHSRRLRSNL